MEALINTGKENGEHPFLISITDEKFDRNKNNRKNQLKNGYIKIIKISERDFNYINKSKKKFHYNEKIGFFIFYPKKY